MDLVFYFTTLKMIKNNKKYISQSIKLRCYKLSVKRIFFNFQMYYLFSAHNVICVHVYDQRDVQTYKKK